MNLLLLFAAYLIGVTAFGTCLLVYMLRENPFHAPENKAEWLGAGVISAAIGCLWPILLPVGLVGATIAAAAKYLKHRLE